MDKSSGASAAFSSKGLGMASAAAAKAKGALGSAGAPVFPLPKEAARVPSAAPRPAPAPQGASPRALAGGLAPSQSGQAAAAPPLAPAAPIAPVFETWAAQEAKRAQAEAAAPVASLSLSPESRALAGEAQKAATTVDAGAPAGAGKRLRAYGQSQQALAPKGGGFDGSA